MSTFEEELLLSDGRTLSPSKLACLLRIPLNDLAHILKVETYTLEQQPESDQVQRFVRDVLHIVDLAEGISGARHVVMSWLNRGLEPYDGKSPLQLIAEGRKSDLVDYLRSISAGFTG